MLTKPDRETDSTTSQHHLNSQNKNTLKNSQSFLPHSMMPTSCSMVFSAWTKHLRVLTVCLETLVVFLMFEDFNLSHFYKEVRCMRKPSTPGPSHSCWQLTLLLFEVLSIEAKWGFLGLNLYHRIRRLRAWHNGILAGDCSRQQNSRILPEYIPSGLPERLEQKIWRWVEDLGSETLIDDIFNPQPINIVLNRLPT